MTYDAMAYDDLEEALTSIMADDPSVPIMPGGVGFDMIGFSDPAWFVYKRVWGANYDNLGKFIGTPRVNTPGGRQYTHIPNHPEFAFVRTNGQVIVPGVMKFDGGSIPRVFWAIPGLDPWEYMPAFIIHDWQFMMHHSDPNCEYGFEEVNKTLAEAIFTLMIRGQVAENWRILVAIYTAVSSIFGKQAWDRQWTNEELKAVLNP